MNDSIELCEKYSKAARSVRDRAGDMAQPEGAIGSLSELLALAVQPPRERDHVDVRRRGEMLAAIISGLIATSEAGARHRA